MIQQLLHLGNYLSQQKPDNKPTTPKPPAKKATNRKSHVQAINDLKGRYIKQFGKTRIEQWSKRPIAGTNIPSLHTYGEALDLFGKDLQAKADWALKQPGVKIVIYNHRCWNPKRGWHPYTGENPHTDHVHVDMGRSETSAIKKSSKSKTKKSKADPAHPSDAKLTKTKVDWTTHGGLKEGMEVMKHENGYVVRDQKGNLLNPPAKSPEEAIRLMNESRIKKLAQKVQEEGEKDKAPTP